MCMMQSIYLMGGKEKQAIYRNVPKFSDRYAWANNADPDQTAPMVEPHSSNFREITTIFWVSKYLGNLW